MNECDVQFQSPVLEATVPVACELPSGHEGSHRKHDGDDVTTWDATVWDWRSVSPRPTVTRVVLDSDGDA